MVHDVHRLACLGVRLTNFEDGGGSVQNGSKSSLGSDVKAKKKNDPNLVELKKMILEKSAGHSPKMEKECFDIKDGCVF